MNNFPISPSVLFFEPRDLSGVISGNAVMADFPLHLPPGFGAPEVRVANQSSHRMLVSFAAPRRGLGGAQPEPQVHGTVMPGQEQRFCAPPGQPFGWVLVWLDPIGTPVSPTMVEVSA